ncbi:MAG: glycosyltransferase family 9 protein [Desulfovibrionaceae bacterium]|nr:glycosyltransferase family 9 protein [Desulfovibrionaceae bacterium]
MHWLLFRLSSLGDVALTSGPMRYWHERLGWEFTVLTRKIFAPLFTRHPAVREVISPQDHDLATGWPGFCRSLAAAYQGSGLMDLHGNWRSRLLSCFWRGPVRRYPKQGLARRLFLLHKSPGLSARLRAHSVPQRYLLAAQPVPPLPGELRPAIYLQPEERALAKEKLRAARTDGRGGAPVAIHPYAAHPLKTWPPDYWRTLAEKLDAAGRSWFVVGRGPGLFPGEARDFSNRTDLRELCALLGEAEILISGDSGPMHLATAVDTPVLALFGPTTVEWGFFPTGAKDLALEKELPCRPCSMHGRARCPRDGLCLLSITPEEVTGLLEKP